VAILKSTRRRTGSQCRIIIFECDT